MAFIVDCFSQKIVSWHTSIKRDVELVDVPLRMASWRRTHDGNPVGRASSFITRMPGRNIRVCASPST